MVATITELWRYPVKSMQGESVTTTHLAADGLRGDRTFAIVDREHGGIASAKHPTRFAALAQCHARFTSEPGSEDPLPPVHITLSNGTEILSDSRDVDAKLSEYLERHVTLVVRGAGAATVRQTDRSDAVPGEAGVIVRDEPLALSAPAGTFFDVAPIHMVASDSLRALSRRAPALDFDVRRFRANIVVDAGDGLTDGAESYTPPEFRWLGQSLSLGSAARVRVTDPTPRCVVTTLARGALAREIGILRTLADTTEAASLTLAPGVRFRAVLGIYAIAESDGVVRVGDVISRADTKHTPSAHP